MQIISGIRRVSVFKNGKEARYAVCQSLGASELAVENGGQDNHAGSEEKALAPRYAKRESERNLSRYAELRGSSRHVLISHGPNQTPAKVLQPIKVEFSHWVNENNLSNDYFEWQDDCFANSVSDSAVPRVGNYIGNQEVHHGRLSYKEEYEELVKRNGDLNHRVRH